MNLKSIFAKNWHHFAILGVFLVITLVYFSPEYNGYSLKQHDIEQFAGMAQETKMYREQFDKEPMWMNNMFGGMPTVQVSLKYEGNIFQSSMIWFLRNFGVPSGLFLMHLVCFYIMCLCLRIKPLVGFLGAVAFAFASYEIVILQAGHNSKSFTVALMAPVVGAFLMTYKHNWKLGALLSALFMSYQIASNHLQVTYYLGFFLLAMGIYEMVKALRTKSIKDFGIRTGVLLAAYGLAVFVNFGNVGLTADYAKHTIRGGNDVTITPDGIEAQKNTSGLDKDYITNWSYGIGESMTLLSPYVKGSASVGIQSTSFAEDVQNSGRTREEINEILNSRFPVYWGQQPITSGPVYIGIVVFFLMCLGLVYLKGNRKWVMFGVGILALMLSWGKNYMGLTDFFIENVPMYNKFRTVTIILVLIELIVPLIGVLFLNQLYKERESMKGNVKPFLFTAGGLFAFLLIVKMVGLGDNYTSQRDRDQLENMPGMVMNQLRQMNPQQLQQNNIDLNNAAQVNQIVEAQVKRAENQFAAFKGFRMELFDKSMNRSLILLVLAAGIVALIFYTNIKTEYVVGALIVLVLFDLVPVGLNYLNNEEDEKGNLIYWMPEEEKKFPIGPNQADLQILEMEMQRDPEVKKAVEEGERYGKQKAEELGYTGRYRNIVTDVYRMSALNFATNYRVFEYNNAWGSARASTFHKNLGGYHGAKLRNIQNLFDFHIAQGNSRIFNMMNVKYFINNGQAIPNPENLGSAWLAKDIVKVDTPNDEILALGTVYSVNNAGAGQLMVNGTNTPTATVTGGQTIEYVINNDTLPVNINRQMKEGMSAYFVMDNNGRTDFVPQQMVDADSTNSFSKLVLLTVKQDFDPKNEVVVLKDEADGLKDQYSGEGDVRMESYLPNEMRYKVSAKEPQLVVFSEVYYPDGWTATVNGKETEIRKVNYLLRAVEVPAGDNEVVLTFELTKLKTANVMSIGGTLLLLLGFVWYFYRRRKHEKKDGDVA